MKTINQAEFMQELSKRPEAAFRDKDGKLNYYFHIDVKNKQALIPEPEKIVVYCPEDELLFFLRQIMNYSIDTTGEFIYFKIA